MSSHLWYTASTVSENLLYLLFTMLILCKADVCCLEETDIGA